MACERLRNDPAAQGHAEALEAELARLRAGLADLTAARTGRPRREPPATLELERLARSAVAGWQPALEAEGRPATVHWWAGRPRITADPGRLAQALGNLVANAAEHGTGAVELRSRRTGGAVRVEVRNGRPKPDGAGRANRAGRDGAGGGDASRSERGRGLRIATLAAESAGGRLRVVPEPDRMVAALELPVDEPDPGPGPDAA
jgi:hypothetical protein